MLPDGFRWSSRHQYDTQDTALLLGGRQVAMLLQRLDGSWFARLDSHKGFGDPLELRDCTSLEAGRAGVEEWACRHEGRLRREVSLGVAPSPRPTPGSSA